MRIIALTQGRSAIVDDEDFERLNSFSWCFTNQGYACRGYRSGGKQHKVYLHRYIMNPPSGMEIDHINGNGLDNRKDNLRVCLGVENRRNKGLSKKNTTGYKGIYYNTGVSRWYAQIKVNNKKISLGGSDTKQEAAEKYNRAAKLYFGEFGSL